MIFYTRNLIFASLFCVFTSFAENVSVQQVTPSGFINNFDQVEKIQVTFDRPMVALAKLPEGNGSGPLKISPEVKGKFRWKGTDVLIFVPEKSLELATEYHVEIPEGTKSEVSEDKLADAYRWTFTTPVPKISEVSPGSRDGASDVPLQRTIYFQYNQPIDISSFKKLVSISPNVDLDIFTPCDTCVHELYSPEYPEQINKFGRKRVDVVAIRPKSKFQMATEYVLKVKSGVKSLAGGPLTETSDYNYTINTIKPQVFKGLLESGDTAESLEPITNVDPHGSLLAVFLNEISLSQFVKHTHFQPALSFPPSFAEADWALDRIDLNQGFMPATKYSVTFDADLTDIYGNKLGQTVSSTFTTGNFSPYLKAITGHGIVEFNSKRRVPLEIVNINELPVQFWALKADRIVPLLQTKDLFYQSKDIGLTDKCTKQIIAKFNSATNLRQRVPLYLDTVLGAKPGAVFMQVIDHITQKSNSGNNNNTSNNSQYLKSLVQVTNLGITAKFGYDNSIVVVSTLDSGTPVEGASVEIRNSGNTIVWTGKTDNDGKAVAPSWHALGMIYNKYESPVQYVFVYQGQDWSFISSDWESGISPWRFNLQYKTDMQPSNVYSGTIVTDRALYRPGETVYGKGFVRRLENGSWQPVKHSNVEISVVCNAQTSNYDEESEGSEESEDNEESEGDDNSSAIVYKDTVTLAKIGSFDFKYKVPKESRLGTYFVNIHVIGFEQEMTDKKFKEDIRGAFRVAEFKPAELEVKVVPEKVNYFYGDHLHATISSNYLFGAPVKNESFSWLIRKFRFYFNPNGYEDFSFEKSSENDDNEYGDYERDCNPEVIVSDSGVLDSKGFANINYNLLKPEKAQSEYYQVAATVTGKSNQPISSWSSVIVHQSTNYVGIKRADYICYENKPTRFEIVVLTPEEKRTAGKKVSVSIVRRNWVSVRKTEIDGRLSWDSQTKDSLIQQNVIESHESGSDTISFTPPISGYYIVNASIIDKSDTVSASSSSIYACGSSYSSWSRADDDYIDVISDRKKYVPGETAHILVKSPFKSAKALLTVEREGIMLTKWITLTGAASTIDLPITSNYLPNVYVSVMIIRGRTSKQDFDNEGNDLSKPVFKIGYCKFAVEPSGKRLQVSVVPEKKEYQPGDSVKVSLQVPQLAGKNYASDVLLMAVDEGVLMLSGYKTPDIFSFFYGPRPLCVLTSELRGSVIGERNYGEKGKNRGGSGGNSDIFDKLTARGNFKICAYFNPRVVLDKNGSATVSFKLPDNLSTFRLMAVTQTAMSEFGSADARITVNKRLMLRPLMPRFLRMGDSCSAGVIAENYSDATDTLKLLTQANLLHLAAGEKKQLVITKNSNAYALMPMVADTFTDSISYTFKGILGKNSDAVTGKIPLIFEHGIETVAISGSTADSTHQQLQIPDGTYRQFDSLSTTLSSTALTGLGESVRYLYEYPYGCLEQRTSCVLPLILYNDMMSAFGKSTLKNTDVSSVVQEYLNMMHKFQCSNGGFDYWNPPSHDSPYLTAYAVLALLKAEQKGFKIDKSCKSKALDYLQTFLDGNHNRSKYPYGDYEWNATEAFIVAVLAEAGMYQADDVERLYKKRAQMPIYGLAQLYKAVSLGNGDAQIKINLKTMLNNSAKIEAVSVHFEEPQNTHLSWIHSSNVHTTATVLISILEVDKKHPQAEKIAHWLIQQQKNNRWNSTHENLYAFWALAEYFKAYEGDTPDFTAKAKVDGQSWMEQQFKGRSTKQFQTKKSLANLEPGKNVGLDFVKSGPGRLYYQMRMQYTPKAGLAPRDEGIAIKREYKSINGNTIDPPLFKIGQPVIVTLTITTKQDMLYVAVNDPIPAGCEIIDPSLSVVSPELVDKISSVNNVESDYWWGSWNHTEYRDQRCLLFADFLNRGTHTFSYLLRPTIEGAFYTPPAHVEEMYSPEVFGRTGECQVTIKK
jgi:uncharacterized protein YfaS (alpha-2-macroglobulin family)